MRNGVTRYLGADPMAADGIDGRRYRHSLYRGKREDGEEPASKSKLQILSWCGE